MSLFEFLEGKLSRFRRESLTLAREAVDAKRAEGDEALERFRNMLDEVKDSAERWPLAEAFTDRRREKDD